MELELDARACYRALRTRDPRFDGRFFTGVATTGVYCRPVCPARTPRAENCRFFPHAAAAAARGDFSPAVQRRWEADARTAASRCKGHGRLERRTLATTTWLNDYLRD